MAVIREKQAGIARSKAEVSARLAQWDSGPGSEEAIQELREIARLGLPAATYEERRAFLEGMGVQLRADGNKVTITGLITERTLAITNLRTAAVDAERALLCNSPVRRSFCVLAISLRGAGALPRRAC
jgi:hypothetical protein